MEGLHENGGLWSVTSQEYINKEAFVRKIIKDRRKSGNLKLSASLCLRMCSIELLKNAHIRTDLNSALCEEKTIGYAPKELEIISP